MQRAFLKGPEVMPSSNASSTPEMFGRWVPASTSFRDILGSFISQALPNGTVTAGQFRSTDGMVRGRECRFLLFLLCGVYSLEMYDIKVFVTETGSSFYFVAWTVKPQIQVLDIYLLGILFKKYKFGFTYLWAVSCAKKEKKGHS